VAVICGGVVAQNAPLLLQSTTTASASVGLPVIVGSVLLLHTLGFAAGYLIPKFGFGRSETSARTISIEVGMQNSALAVVLARSIGAHPLASLPGALSATVHSCLGSMLAAYWRLQESSALKAAAAVDAEIEIEKDDTVDDKGDVPEFQI
jgi:BASS family bile acid:Na+ symporter